MGKCVLLLAAAQILANGCPPQRPVTKAVQFDDSMRRAYDARMFGDWAGVRNAAGDAVSVHPHRPDPYILLAQAMCATGATSDGLAILKKAVDLGARPDAIGGMCRTPSAAAQLEVILQEAQRTADSYTRAHDDPAQPSTWRSATAADLESAAAAFAADCARVREDRLEYGPELRFRRWVEVVNNHIGRMLTACRSGARTTFAAACVEALRAVASFAELPDGSGSGVTPVGVARARDAVLAEVAPRLLGRPDVEDVLWAKMVAAAVLGREAKALRLQSEYVIRFPGVRRARLPLLAISDSCAGRRDGRTEQERAACEMVARDAVLRTKDEPTSLDALRQWYGEGLDEVVLSDREFFARRFPVAALAGQSVAWMQGVAADGKAFDFTTLSGERVVVEFWAMACASCFENMDMLRQMRDDLEGRVTLLGVNVDGATTSWDGVRLQALAAKQGFSWPQLVQPRGLDDEIPRRLGIRHVPVTLFVDEAQVIRGVRLGRLSRQDVLSFAR